jgi:hypothetical protein
MAAAPALATTIILSWTVPAETVAAKRQTAKAMKDFIVMGMG